MDNKISACLVSCTVSLETGEVSDFELLDDDCEIDASEYIAFKTNELLQLHENAVPVI